VSGLVREAAGAHSARTIRTAALVLFATTLAACAFVSTARADGDPASDYLLEQQVFFPFDTKFPAERQAQFSGLVRAANRAGFRIRVALIASSYDMGSVTALYGKPRLYARFLGEELSFVYKQRLLVVMPNGFGFNWPEHRSAPAYAVLVKIPVESDATGLLDAAQTAVQRLAAADGVEVVPPPLEVAPVSRHNSHVLLVVIAIVLSAIVLAAAAWLALRVRRT
jgi:hypothetical protein